MIEIKEKKKERKKDKDAGIAIWLKGRQFSFSKAETIP